VRTAEVNAPVLLDHYRRRCEELRARVAALEGVLGMFGYRLGWDGREYVLDGGPCEKGRKNG
jgi:hypothetical protein